MLRQVAGGICRPSFARYVCRPDNNAFRLVHGEGDFLPGLVVDIYGPTAVMQAHSPGMHYARAIIAGQLVAIPGLGGGKQCLL